jgi:hypothetical protein
MNAQPNVILGFFLLLPCCLCNIRVQTGRNMSAKVRLGLSHEGYHPEGWDALVVFFVRSNQKVEEAMKKTMV